MRHYHADNGTYAVAKYREDIENSKQTLTFCGVGGHHQNGKAEKRIKIVCNPARSMLFHAMCHWPQVINPTLWPFDLSAEADMRNKSKKDDSGFSPLERLTGMTQPIVPRDLHPFGCPAFVFSADL